MFFDYYKILGVDHNADNNTIKTAYKKQMLQYHPDKVIHMGEGFQKAAKEKFQKIQDSYENIKKTRGFV